MRKVFLLTFAAVLLAGSAAPAFADNGSDDNSYSNNSSTNHHGPKPGTQDDENQAKHNHISDLFEDITGVIIPPAAIKPGHRPNSGLIQLQGTVANPDANADLNNGPLPDQLSDGLSGVTDPNTEYSLTKLGSKTSTATKTVFSPTKSKPVQVKTIVLTKATPTDEFMTGALVLGGSLSLVALVLLTLTSIHHLQLRRKP